MNAHSGNPSIAPSDDAISRRTVARGLLCGGLVAGFLAATDRRYARAQATPAAGTNGPVRYELKGDDIDLAFTPSDSPGDARLDYRDAKAAVSFSGDDLMIEHSQAVGQLVSALTEYAADGYDRYLTLLVPEVNPDEDGGDVLIHTVAIVTTHLTSIGGPALVKGPLQSYEIVALDGKAVFGTA